MPPGAAGHDHGRHGGLTSGRRRDVVRQRPGPLAVARGAVQPVRHGWASPPRTGGWGPWRDGLADRYRSWSRSSSGVSRESTQRGPGVARTALGRWPVGASASRSGVGPLARASSGRVGEGQAGVTGVRVGGDPDGGRGPFFTGPRCRRLTEVAQPRRSRSTGSPAASRTLIQVPPIARSVSGSLCCWAAWRCHGSPLTMAACIRSALYQGSAAWDIAAHSRGGGPALPSTSPCS